MIDFTPSEIAQYYASRVPDLRQTKTDVWRGKCPVHNGEGDNFAVDARTGMSHCHSQCGKGWDVLGLEMELWNQDFRTAKREVYKLLGKPEPSYADRDVVAAYDYVDESGELAYQVVRKFPKRFVQRRPDGSGGWIWSLGNIPRVPYQLTQLLKQKSVVICEGEKDAIALTKRGLFATCNSEGAGNWKPELAPYFKDKRVVIIPDNDEPGRKHALKVAESLHGMTQLLRIVELPDMPAKGDISDYLASGKTVDDLKALIAASQPYTPDFQFTSAIPSEEDQWVRNAAEVVRFAGGMDEFWNMASEDGIPTPFTQLTEELSGGLRDGEMYILAGPRGEGKTSMLMQFISKTCKNEKGVLMFSLEMGDKDVLRRLVSMEERVDLSQTRILQRKSMTREITGADSHLLRAQMAKLKRGTQRVQKYPLLVHQRPAVNPQYLIEETKRLAARQKIRLVCIDHAQLMSSTGNEQKDYEKFTAISRALKGQVARELKIPILVISQISRNAASEKRGELEITDLRGSGAWEEDAAAVFLLYHDQQHMSELKMQGTLGKGPVLTHLKLGKNRFGSSGTYVDLMHFKAYTRFESNDPADYEPDMPAEPVQLEVA